MHISGIVQLWLAPSWSVQMSWYHGGCTRHLDFRAVGPCILACLAILQLVEHMGFVPLGWSPLPTVYAATLRQEFQPEGLNTGRARN